MLTTELYDQHYSEDALKYIKRDRYYLVFREILDELSKPQFDKVRKSLLESAKYLLDESIDLLRIDEDMISALISTNNDALALFFTQTLDFKSLEKKNSFILQALMGGCSVQTIHDLIAMGCAVEHPSFTQKDNALFTCMVIKKPPEFFALIASKSTSFHADPKMLKNLVSNLQSLGIRIERRSAYGQLYLDYITALLTHGADPYLKGDDGLSASDLVNMGNHDILKTLFADSPRARQADNITTANPYLNAAQSNSFASLMVHLTQNNQKLDPSLLLERAPHGFNSLDLLVDRGTLYDLFYAPYWSQNDLDQFLNLLPSHHQQALGYVKEKFQNTLAVDVLKKTASPFKLKAKKR